MEWPMQLRIPMVDSDVVLRPYIAEQDAPLLFRVLNDPVVWQHGRGQAPDSVAALAARFATRLSDGLRSAWVIEVAGDVVGTTSFIFDPADGAGLEIGATCLAPPFWGSGVNHRAKRMMVSAAFDADAAWVQFRTDERNLRSAAAILKLGAVELPAQQDRWIRADGTHRVSRFFRLFSRI